MTFTNRTQHIPVTRKSALVSNGVIRVFESDYPLCKKNQIFLCNTKSVVFGL